MAPWACSLSRHAPRTSEDVVKQPAPCSPSDVRAQPRRRALQGRVHEEPPERREALSRGPLLGRRGGTAADERVLLERTGGHRQGLAGIQPGTGSAARRTAGAGQPELCRQVLDEAPAELDPTSRVAKAIAHNRGLCMGDGSFAEQVFYSGLLISSPGWSATGSWHGQLSERCGILNTLDFSS